jgi:di/tricarboxylate transporter
VPWREVRIECGQSLGVLGAREDVMRFVQENGLSLHDEQGTLLDDLQQGTTGGFAEVMVHPHSDIIGKTMREIQLRRHYSVEPVLLASGADIAHHDFSDRPFQSGDTLVVYGSRRRLRDLAADERFVLLTRIEDPPASRGTKAIAALCFAGAVGLAVAGFPLSISLLTGAIVMVLTRILTIDEAYAAVDWRTVFLLAGLIPLGIAMDNTGAAAVVADWLTVQLSSAPVVVTLFAVGLLATLFSLFMSNVAATVLLVPLVMLLGQSSGIDPRGLALLVAVSASNSFVLPTHQVNALLMGPGQYSNRDYLRAGSVMSLIFLTVAVGFVYLFYLG